MGHVGLGPPIEVLTTHPLWDLTFKPSTCRYNFFHAFIDNYINCISIILIFSCYVYGFLLVIPAFADTTHYDNIKKYYWFFF